MDWTTAAEGTCNIVEGGRLLANLPQTAPFRESILAAARGAGIGQFSVFKDNEEIVDPADSPETFEGLTTVELKHYQKAG